MTRLGRTPGFPAVVMALAFVFLGLFFLNPLARVFSASLFDASGVHFTLANYIKVLSSGFYRASIANTLGIGAAATLLATLLALPLAFALVRVPLRGKSILIALSTLPLVLPS